MVSNRTSTLANARVAVCQDTYGGEPSGACITTNWINPANWTRSYVCLGYIDLTSLQSSGLLFQTNTDLVPSLYASNATRSSCHT